MKTTLAVLMLAMGVGCGKHAKDAEHVEGMHAIVDGVAKFCDYDSRMDLRRIYCQNGVVMDGDTRKPWKAPR